MVVPVCLRSVVPRVFVGFPVSLLPLFLARARARSLAWLLLTGYRYKSYNWLLQNYVHTFRAFAFAGDINLKERPATRHTSGSGHPPTAASERTTLAPRKLSFFRPPRRHREKARGLPRAPGALRRPRVYRHLLAPQTTLPHTHVACAPNNFTAHTRSLTSAQKERAARAMLIITSLWERASCGAVCRGPRPKTKPLSRAPRRTVIQGWSRRCRSRPAGAPPRRHSRQSPSPAKASPPAAQRWRARRAGRRR